MKKKRIYGAVILIACFISFGIWTKLSSVKANSKNGGGEQHTSFYDTKGPELLKSTVWKSKFEEQEYARDIILHKNRVICFTSNGVKGIDADTGKELWKFEQKFEEITLNFTYGYSPMACYDGVVYFPVKEKIIGLDVDTGKEKWSFSQKYNFNTTSLMVRDGFIYCGTSDGTLHAINIKSKKEKWKKENSQMVGNLAIDKEVLYANDSKNIMAISLKDGKQQWKVELNRTVGITVGDKCLYIKETVYDMVSDKQKLTALDKKTGKELWSYGNQDAVTHGRFAYHDGKVFIIDMTFDKDKWNVTKSAIKALDGDTGRELWSFGRDMVFSGLAVTKDGLYACSSSKQLIKLDPKNGNKISAVNFDCEAIISPIFKDKELYCIGFSSDDNGDANYLIKAR